jgi:rubrerythrin
MPNDKIEEKAHKALESRQGIVSGYESREIISSLLQLVEQQQAEIEKQITAFESAMREVKQLREHLRESIYLNLHEARMSEVQEQLQQSREENERMRGECVRLESEIEGWKEAVGMAKIQTEDKFRAELEQVKAERAELWNCSDCGFGFDAGHTDVGGGYSCPLCELEAKDKVLEESYHELATIHQILDKTNVSEKDAEDALRRVYLVGDSIGAIIARYTPTERGDSLDERD